MERFFYLRKTFVEPDFSVTVLVVVCELLEIFERPEVYVRSVWTQRDEVVEKVFS